MSDREYDLRLEVVPVLDNVPEDDTVEPEDAEIDHHGG